MEVDRTILAMNLRVLKFCGTVLEQLDPETYKLPRLSCAKVGSHAMSLLFFQCVMP